MRLPISRRRFRRGGSTERASCPIQYPSSSSYPVQSLYVPDSHNSQCVRTAECGAGGRPDLFHIHHADRTDRTERRRRQSETAAAHYLRNLYREGNTSKGERKGSPRSTGSATTTPTALNPQSPLKVGAAPTPQANRATVQTDDNEFLENQQEEEEGEWTEIAAVEWSNGSLPHKFAFRS